MSYWDAYNSAYNAGQKRNEDFQNAFNQGVQQKAGNALAGGDYTGAQNALYRSGQIEQGHQVGQYQQQQRDVQQAQQDRERKQHAEVILKATDAIRRYAQMKPDASPTEAFDAVAPLLGQITDPQALAHIRQQFAQDPQSVLAMAENAAREELKVLSPGSVAINNRGETVASAPFAPTRPQAVAPGGTLVGGDGQPIYQAPERTEYHNVPEGGKLVATGGGAASPALAQISTSLTSAFPGVQITSGQRSPQHNAAVGGVPNSQHIAGNALDFTKAPGVTLAAVKQHFAEQGVNLTEAIDEGDHIHIAWGPKGGGARVVAEGNPKKDIQTPKEAMQLRKEFNQLPDVKQFQTVATQYGIVNRLASQPPTAANDVSLIFAYMKLLDPTSVVREGEFATAQNATGVPAQVANTYNKLMKGERLNPEQRKQFTSAAGNVFNENKSRYDQLVQQYQGYAASIGLDASTIQPRVAPSAATPPPKGAAQAQGGGKRLSADEARKLPKGARFVGLDGVARVKH